MSDHQGMAAWQMNNAAPLFAIGVAARLRSRQCTEWALPTVIVMVIIASALHTAR